MKICYLGSADSIHTVRWVNSMVNRGHEVYLITMHPPKNVKIDRRVKVIKLIISAPFGYYFNFMKAKKIIKSIEPDILHSHYASGYGTLSRLLKFSPTLLSVWGSDVYIYPYRKKINMDIIKKNLMAPNLIASTSKAMKDQTKSIIQTNRDIVITPFGIDTEKFRRMETKKKDSTKITIGTVKTMEPIYGIDYLLRAFKIVYESITEDIKIELLLVGGGSNIDHYKKLAEKLKIDHITTFVGQIPHGDVPSYLNKLDIYCAPSLSESFGVAIIEASACELPVIVSDVGGLPEVVLDNKTGYIIPSKNEKILAERILDLTLDEMKRIKFGKRGRKFVIDEYNWDNNVDKMEEVYSNMLKMK